MSATLDASSLFEASSSSTPFQTAGTSASSASNKSPEKEREDKLLNAKKKLKSYRARQSKANNSLTPSSPSKTSSSSTGSTSSLTSIKRSSYIAPSRQVSISSSASTSIGGGGGKTAHGHAHRRSHSRNLSISTGASAGGPTLLSSTLSPQERKEREARRSSLIFGKVDAAAVAAACVNAANGTSSPLAGSTASTPTQPAPARSNATTPTQATATATSSSSQASTSQTTAPTSSSASAINDYHANRRNSRRHSRTSSISISIAPSTFDGFAAVSPSGTASTLVSPRKLSYGALPPTSASSSSPAPKSRSPKNTTSSFPASASSPSLSSTLASFTLGGGSAMPPPRFQLPMQSSTTSQQQKILNRQSVPAFATAAQHTLQNGRMVLSAHTGASISPQTSPQPPQHAFLGAAGAINHGFGSASGNGGMLNPASAAGWNRRASLGVPKSPSFFESQQLAISHSEQGAPSSSSSTSPASASTTPSGSQHARKNSRHSRKISVSIRRESMEIMAGVMSSLLPSSPDMPDSAEMNRLASGSTSSGNNDGYDMTVLGSSLAMDERQLSEEEERDFALSRLEGRLAVKADMIQLPDESSTTDNFSSSLTNSTNSSSNSAAPAAGQQAKLLSSTRSDKRNSWNPRDSWGTTSPFSTSAASTYNGPKTGNLDMLVEEEEEEEEEEAEDEETETETEREVETTHEISVDEEEQSDEPVSNSTSTSGKRSRPGTLTFAPRKLSLSSVSSDEKVVSPPASASSNTHSSIKIGGQQRVPPRPLSLMSSSSMGNLSNISASSDVKAARRQSGLRSLTLTSPEHVLNGPSSAISPATSNTSSGAMQRRRLSLLNSAVSPSSMASPSPSSTNGGGIRPFSISSSSSILSPDASLRSNFQFGSSTKEAHLQAQQQQNQSGTLVNGLPVRQRKSFSTASNASVASSAISTPSRAAGSSAPPTGRPSLNYNNSANGSTSASATRFSRRFSDMASPVSAGFGDLVMEESLMEEDEDQLDDDEESALQHEKILDGLNREENDERSAQQFGRLTPESAADMSRTDSSITNISVSDDPVILDLQVRALKSQVEHLRAQLSTSDSARKEEVESLRYELSEVRENMLNAEEEREMLREDIDGWRTRCADLERALQNERAKLDDERREGMLLREKVRKLGDRLAQTQNGPAGSSPSAVDGDTSSPDGTIDASLVNAQAKLIGEMRDQIFSLAAALERERMRNAGETEQDPSRSSSPLLRALASQDEKIAACLNDDDDTAVAADELADKLNRNPQHHNTSTQSSAASGSYNFSSSFSSFHSQMGNNTEDTSIGDDNDSMYGGKSPTSPAFWASSPTPSYSQASNAGNGISIHASSTPLRNSDLCMNFGGLQTLAEEDEEEIDDEDFIGAIAEVNAQAKKALSLSDLSEEEENDAVPELVHEEALSQRRADFEALRARTQSASTGSSMDTNDHMPLTPAKEHGSPNLGAQSGAQQQSKPSHNRSDSFIKQWSFPKGPVEPIDLTQHHHNDSFWALYQGSLPALPLSASLVEAPPFSAEIALDEEYFHMATEKPLPASRPSSTISLPSRPPMTSRTSSQIAKIKEQSEAPAAAHLNPSPASGSRISLQGFSSLWGNYLRGPQTPPSAETAANPLSSATASKAVAVSAPASQSSSFSSKTAVSQAPTTGRKPLLRLQPSPLGNLNFAHASACCAADVTGHSHRILHL